MSVDFSLSLPKWFIKQHSALISQHYETHTESGGRCKKITKITKISRGIPMDILIRINPDVILSSKCVYMRTGDWHSKLDMSRLAQLAACPRQQICSKSLSSKCIYMRTGDWGLRTTHCSTAMSTWPAWHSGFFACFVLLWPRHDHFSSRIDFKGVPLWKINQFVVTRPNW